jgi:hypothetical protein
MTLILVHRPVLEIQADLDRDCARLADLRTALAAAEERHRAAQTALGRDPAALAEATAAHSEWSTLERATDDTERRLQELASEMERARTREALEQEVGRLSAIASEGAAARAEFLQARADANEALKEPMARLAAARRRWIAARVAFVAAAGREHSEAIAAVRSRGVDLEAVSAPIGGPETEYDRSVELPGLLPHGAAVAVAITALAHEDLQAQQRELRAADRIRSAARLAS